MKGFWQSHIWWSVFWQSDIWWSEWPSLNDDWLARHYRKWLAAICWQTKRNKIWNVNCWKESFQSDRSTQKSAYIFHPLSFLSFSCFWKCFFSCFVFQWLLQKEIEGRNLKSIKMFVNHLQSNLGSSYTKSFNKTIIYSSQLLPASTITVIIFHYNKKTYKKFPQNKNGFFDGQTGLVWKKEKLCYMIFLESFFWVWKSNITVNRAATHSVRNLNQFCQVFSLPSLTCPCSLFSSYIFVVFRVITRILFLTLLFKTLFLLMFLTLLFLTLIFKTFSFLTILLFLEILLLLKT